jgi:hypothetical protein
MSKDTDKSLFILPSMPRLYQQLLTGVVSFEALGNRIIAQIKAAHAFRQVEQVKELASILINIPIREFQLIAQYYLVWCKCRDLEYRTDALERIIEQSQTYKTKALFSRGAIEWFRGKPEAALRFYGEALKTIPSISEYIDLLRSIAVLKATEGFHKSALKDLENLLPIIRHGKPLAYYETLNSYAVELAEAGRLQEAENVSSLTIASPFAPFYPEWQSTFSEIRSKRKSRSTATISPSQELSEPEPESESQPARVVTFPPLKEAPPPQKPERLSPRELSELTASEKGELILAAIKSGMLRDSDYDRLMHMIGLLHSGPADKVLDLEDDKILDDIAIVWSNNIEPEELTAVLSVLRDCDDDLRRNNIIDRMIRIAFEQSLLCNITESEWRRRVERRLPER